MPVSLRLTVAVNETAVEGLKGSAGCEEGGWLPDWKNTIARVMGLLLDAVAVKVIRSAKVYEAPSDEKVIAPA